MPSSPEPDPLVELLDQYHQCFYDRAVGGLADLYIDHGGFVYFDNHPRCDAVDLGSHLKDVADFLAAGPPASLDVRVLSSRLIGDAGLLVARVRYADRDHPTVRLTLVAEQRDSRWRIAHLHYSNDPNDDDALAEASGRAVPA